MGGQVHHAHADTMIKKNRRNKKWPCTNEKSINYFLSQCKKWQKSQNILIATGSIAGGSVYEILEPRC